MIYLIFLNIWCFKSVFGSFFTNFLEALSILRLIYLAWVLNSLKIPVFFRISIAFIISGESHHFILCPDKKQNNNKKKCENFFFHFHFHFNSCIENFFYSWEEFFYTCKEICFATVTFFFFMVVMFFIVVIFFYGCNFFL